MQQAQSSRHDAISTELPSCLQVYADLKDKYPRSNAAKRIPLNFLTGERFKKAFGEYVKPFLRKGVPSLFSDIKPLYKDTEKVKLMGQHMEANLAALRSQQKLAGEEEVEPPVTILWVLEYLANHYDRVGDSIKALAHIDEALEYTPTVIDLHLTKARIYKHAGDLAAASGMSLCVCNCFARALSACLSVLSVKSAHCHRFWHTHCACSPMHSNDDGCARRPNGSDDSALPRQTNARLRASWILLIDSSTR